jgi:hypothetical protein
MTTPPTQSGQPQIVMRTRAQIDRENKLALEKQSERQKPVSESAAEQVAGFETQIGTAQRLAQTVDPAWLGVRANATANIRERTPPGAPALDAMGLAGMSPEEGAFRLTHFRVGAEVRKAVTGLGGTDTEMKNLDRLYPKLDVGSKELYQGQMQAYVSYANELMQKYAANLTQGKGAMAERVREQGAALEFQPTQEMFKGGTIPSAAQLNDAAYLREHLTPAGMDALRAYRRQQGAR